MPESRDELLSQVAERLNELYDLVKVIYYLAVVPPEVYPLQLLPCRARKIGDNVFIHDRTGSAQWVSFDSPQLHFAPLDFQGHLLGMMFLESVVRQPQSLNAQVLRSIATHLAHHLTRFTTPTSHRPPPVIFDEQWQQVWLEGQAIRLSEKEKRLLWHLYSRAGQLCHRQELLQLLYAEDADGVTRYDRRLDKLMARLRAKLKQVPNNQVVVETVRQGGYRLSW